MVDQRRTLHLPTADNEVPMTSTTTDEETSVRAPRESRETSTRPNDAWLPSSALPVPAPREGWKHRWIRTSTLGHADNTNVSRQFRDGWVACDANDYPELQVMSDLNSRFKGNIEIGGLLLCKAPIEMIEARNKYYSGVANQQMEAVDNNFLRENDPRMPLLNPQRSTRTQFGKG